MSVAIVRDLRERSISLLTTNMKFIFSQVKYRRAAMTFEFRRTIEAGVSQINFRSAIKRREFVARLNWLNYRGYLIFNIKIATNGRDSAPKLFLAGRSNVKTALLYVILVINNYTNFDFMIGCFEQLVCHIYECIITEHGHTKLRIFRPTEID